MGTVAQLEIINVEMSSSRRCEICGYPIVQTIFIDSNSINDNDHWQYCINMHCENHNNAPDGG